MHSFIDYYCLQWSILAVNSLLLHDEPGVLNSSMWLTQQISCYWCHDFLKFNDFSVSFWAARLRFAISTRVMLSAVHCSSYSRLVKPNPVWPQTEWWQGRGDSISVISPSVLASTQVCLTLTLSVFLYLCRFLSSPHSPETQTEKKSVSMHLFVFCVFAWIIVRVHLRMLVYSDGCAEKLPSRQKRKLQKHPHEKSNNVKLIVWEKLFLCCRQHCGLQGKHSRSAERKHFNWTLRFQFA